MIGLAIKEWPGGGHLQFRFYILQFCGVSTKSQPDKDIGVPRDNPHCAEEKKIGTWWMKECSQLINWIYKACIAHQYPRYPRYHHLWWTPIHLYDNTSKDTGPGRPGEAEVHLQDDHLGRMWITTISTILPWIGCDMVMEHLLLMQTLLENMMREIKNRRTRSQSCCGRGHKQDLKVEVERSLSKLMIWSTSRI